MVVERWKEPDREREVAHHPVAVAILARTSGGDVVLVRQFREALRDAIIEAPAGILDVQGERGEDAARRELREETGYRAGSLERLGVLHSSPGFTDERIELYLAEAAEPEGPGETGIEVVRMPLAGAIDAILDGTITDAKTVALLLLMERRSRS